VIALAVGAIAYLRNRNAQEIEIPVEHSRLVASLLHPSTSDLRSSVEAVSGLRRNAQVEAKSEPSEVKLISTLEAGDVDSAQRQWSARRDAVPRDAFQQIAALLENLAQHRNNVELETRLALALSVVSYRHSGLEGWAWQLWNRAEKPAERARVAGVLAVFRNEPENGAFYRASLRFASAAGDLAAEEYANSAMAVARQLAESGQRFDALALYQEVERVTHPGPTWGPAVFNQALLLHQAGYQAASRRTSLRLIGSTVNDREPGGNLMRTNQNYRHEAANLIADSYNSQCAFPWAYRWRLRAAERYRFYSWCGTCASAANQGLSIRLFRDALLAGPFFVLAHMALYPSRTSFAWCMVATLLFVIYWQDRRRRSKARLNLPPASN
jgi:hypothetical protein